MLYRAQYSLFALAGLVLAVSIGCGGNTPYRVVPLEGVITYNGEALEGVVLEFFVEDYRPSGAMVRPGGRFQAVHTQSTDGVPVGTVTMRIAWPGGHDHAPPPAYVPLLAKYGIDSEGYVFELTRGDKNFRIDLE